MLEKIITSIHCNRVPAQPPSFAVSNSNIEHHQMAWVLRL